MSTHNIGFYEEISKIITYYQISSNTHLISSAVLTKFSPAQDSGAGPTGAVVSALDFGPRGPWFKPQPGSCSLWPLIHISHECIKRQLLR